MNEPYLAIEKRVDRRSGGVDIGGRVDLIYGTAAVPWYGPFPSSKEPDKLVATVGTHELDVRRQ